MITPFGSRYEIPPAHRPLVRHPLFLKLVEGRVVGSTGGQVVYVRQLRSHLWKLELLVLPAYRGKGYGSELLAHTCRALETQPAALAMGVFLLISDPEWQQRKNEAVWPKLNFVYVGNTGSGAHIRVRYFKHRSLGLTSAPVGRWSDIPKKEVD